MAVALREAPSTCPRLSRDGPTSDRSAAWGRASGTRAAAALPHRVASAGYRPVAAEGAGSRGRASATGRWRDPAGRSAIRRAGRRGGLPSFPGGDEAQGRARREVPGVGAEERRLCLPDGPGRDVQLVSPWRGEDPEELPAADICRRDRVPGRDVAKAKQVVGPRVGPDLRGQGRRQSAGAARRIAPVTSCRHALGRPLRRAPIDRHQCPDAPAMTQLSCVIGGGCP